MVRSIRALGTMAVLFTMVLTVFLPLPPLILNNFDYSEFFLLDARHIEPKVIITFKNYSNLAISSPIHSIYFELVALKATTLQS